MEECVIRVKSDSPSKPDQRFVVPPTSNIPLEIVRMAYYLVSERGATWSECQLICVDEDGSEEVIRRVRVD